jgi:hypothetical protein
MWRVWRPAHEGERICCRCSFRRFVPYAYIYAAPPGSIKTRARLLFRHPHNSVRGLPVRCVIFVSLALKNTGWETTAKGAKDYAKIAKEDSGQRSCVTNTLYVEPGAMHGTTQIRRPAPLRNTNKLSLRHRRKNDKIVPLCGSGLKIFYDPVSCRR